MNKNVKTKQSLVFIKSKCNQIKQHPSKINNINQAIQKYLEINLPQFNEQNQQSTLIHEQKLNVFLEICQVIKALSSKVNNNNSSNPTNKQGLSTFIDQKVQILVEIFLSSELVQALKNQSIFQFSSDKIIETIIIIFELNNKLFIEKMIKLIVLNENQGSQNIQNKAVLSLFFQRLTNNKILTTLFDNLNQYLKTLNNQSPNYRKQLQSISLFICNIENLENINFTKNTNTQPNLQFQGNKQEQAFKKAFQSVFLEILSLIENSKDLDIQIALYRKLDSKLMSKMSNPLILSSYFLDKFKTQPQIQIQVLSCLFILVGKYGLEFQNFYPQLQKVIQQKNKQGKSIYQLKNSKRFFKLVENALRSSKVPFKTIETMTKTIICQIIEQQSEFSFWALSFFFNLTKKHRKLLDQIKQIPEITLLQRHYNPKIRSLVNELKRDLNKAEYLDIEKFAKVDCKKVTASKVQELCNKLINQKDAEFKVAGLFEDL